jgi:hypothetical protein
MTLNPLGRRTSLQWHIWLKATCYYFRFQAVLVLLRSLMSRTTKGIVEARTACLSIIGLGGTLSIGVALHGHNQSIGGLVETLRLAHNHFRALQVTRSYGMSVSGALLSLLIDSTFMNIAPPYTKRHLGKSSTPTLSLNKPTHPHARHTN